MQILLRRFLFRLLSAPIVRAVQWNKAERATFDAFCRSSCGVKLFEYLRQVVATTTFAAVYQNSVSANHYARGQQDTLALLHRLRVFPSEEESASVLEDEQTGLPGKNADQSDDWRWLGGSGAIG